MTATKPRVNVGIIGHNQKIQPVASLITTPPAPAGVAGETPSGFWWCANCKQEVGAHHVTYQERHEDCGHAVEGLVDTSIVDQLAAMQKQRDEEVWMHAACLSIAEGLPCVETDAAVQASLATRTVFKMRTALAAATRRAEEAEAENAALRKRLAVAEEKLRCITYHWRLYGLCRDDVTAAGRMRRVMEEETADIDPIDAPEPEGEEG